MNQKGGSRTDAVVQFLFFCFIALLAFSVGAFVGKKVSDREYQQAAKKADTEFSRKTASLAKDKDPDALTDKEIEKLSQEFVESEKRKLASESSAKPTKSQQTHSPKADHKGHQKNQRETDHSGYKKYSESHGEQEPHHSKQRQQHSNKNHAKQSSNPNRKKPHQTADKKGASSPAIEKAARRVAKGKAPIENTRKKRKPDSTLPAVATSSVGKYTVQVASYPKENQAKDHAARLKSQGWNSFYVPAEVKGRTWFRVSVGLFTNTTSAQSFRAELLKESSVTSAIVQKIVR